MGLSLFSNSEKKSYFCQPFNFAPFKFWFLTAPFGSGVFLGMMFSYSLDLLFSSALIQRPKGGDLKLKE